MYRLRCGLASPLLVGNRLGILMKKPAAKKTTPKKKINSRTKGKTGELELAEFLRGMGYAARRGQQFSGGGDSPDVVTDIPGVHLECKRVEAGSLYNWLAQAKRDAGTKVPVVAHRRNKEEWVAILPLKSLFELLLLTGMPT